MKDFAGILTGIGKVEKVIGLFVCGPRERWEELIVEWAKEILLKSMADRVNIAADNYHLAYLGLPCGEGLMIKSIDDLPLDSVPCPCGDPGHWMVLFSEKAV